MTNTEHDCLHTLLTATEDLLELVREQPLAELVGEPRVGLARLRIRMLETAVAEARTTRGKERNNRTDGARMRPPEAREEGFYWVFRTHHCEAPEVAYRARGEWWLAGDPSPWEDYAVEVASDRLVFKPRLAPVV